MDRNDISLIITSYFYTRNPRYTFDPKHIYYDIYDMVQYCLNSLHCYLSNIHLFSDMDPRKYVLGNLEKRLQSIQPKLPYETWKEWLLRHGTMIYSKILPLLSYHNSLEFCYLLGNYYHIQNLVDFEQKMKYVLWTEPHDKILFYYTGHGLERYNIYPQNSKVMLLIPDHHLYDPRRLQYLLSKVDIRIPMMIILDCCHSEWIFDRPFRPNTWCIGSTQGPQTCGFFHQAGSLFSYYFLRWLKYDIVSDLSSINYYIHSYRKKNNKSIQDYVFPWKNTSLPLWIFPQK